MQNKSNNQNNSSKSINPFAKALAEVEKTNLAHSNQSILNNPNLAESFSQNHHQNPNSLTQFAENQNNKKAQQNSTPELTQEQIHQQMARDRLRRKLHDQINPVNLKDVFDSRKRQVKEEIEQIRYELKMLVKDINKFHKDIEISVISNVAQPGTEGTYYINFFQKLKAFIMLLRQQIKSATTWAKQMKKKKKKRGSAGMIVDGNTNEQTKAVYDQMHHEVGSTYSNG